MTTLDIFMLIMLGFAMVCLLMAVLIWLDQQRHRCSATIPGETIDRRFKDLLRCQLREQHQGDHLWRGEVSFRWVQDGVDH